MLMLTVYYIENLTYNSNFFSNLAWLFFVLVILGTSIKFSVNFVNNQRKPREIVETEEHKHSIQYKLVEGFQLSKDIGDLVAGRHYVICQNWENIKQAWVYPKGGEDDLYAKIEVHNEAYLEMIEDLENQYTTTITKSKTVEAKLINLPKMYLKSLTVLCIVCMMLDTLLPSRQTAIYMAAAYVAEKVLTADKTTKILDKGYVVLENQLGKWAEESQEVATMLAGTGLDYAKTKLENAEEEK